MRKDFTYFDDLIDFVRADKEITGANAATANRFPVRFVLFDNFTDSYRFVSYIQEKGCKYKSVGDWSDSDCPDVILTYSELSTRIEEYVSSSDDDCIITPFSELARFYKNDNSGNEFNALIRTVAGVENGSNAVAKSRRVYIPMVGLEGKMSLFENDTQCTVWYLKNNDKNLIYNVLLTNNTDFGLNDLSQFNIARNVQEWLDVWKTQPAVKPTIICTSAAIYANAEYAQPDNAFNFIICKNAHDFLVDGLQLKFGNIAYKEEDNVYWERLASKINDIKSFNLEKFFNSYFHIDDLTDYKIFLKTWFGCKDDFEKWLLTTYYYEKFCGDGYICRVINTIHDYSNHEFFSSAALTIFKLDNPDIFIDERFACLSTAQKHGIVLRRDVEERLQNELNALADATNRQDAIRYFSPLTKSEKILAMNWLTKGDIQKNCLQRFFPDLYDYLENSFGTEVSWINDYIDDYKQAKIRNEYTENIAEHIKDKNASILTFNSWYQNLKTTKTILSGRTDIEVFYWIDGLGVDWIPFIKKRLEEQRGENIYLNEIHIARSLCPTTTDVNKKALLELSNGKLKKCGDLDSHAHQNTNVYSQYIIEEFEIVNNAIKTLVDEYNEKKIAIVSDHGLTALSQLCSGLNMAGVESDHHGRTAIYKTESNCPSNNDCFVCDDGKTLCALNHKSLCGKIPNGQSAHGGCTPEEVLVPIFIISSQKKVTHPIAVLLTKNISEADPVVKYTIKGLADVDVPYIVYNNKKYELTIIGNDCYQSDKLSLSRSAATIKLVVSDYEQTDDIDVKLAAEEENLFDF